MSGVMKHTMIVRNPETLEAVALVAGRELPAWAKDIVDEGNLESKSAAKAKAAASSTGDDDGGGSQSGSGDGSDSTPDGGDAKEYAGMKPADLKAEAEKRELEVTGTGANGNVVKGDLVAALEADDAKKAEQA